VRSSRSTTLTRRRGSTKKVEHNFGDPGIKLLALGKGGSDLFLTADDRFAYAFTDYAASGMPLRLTVFSNGTFQQVTKDFPPTHQEGCDAVS